MQIYILIRFHSLVGFHCGEFEQNYEKMGFIAFVGRAIRAH